MSLLARASAVSPFGPIFAKELRSTSRRRRSYALRVFYLAVLLLAMLLAYSVTNRSRYYASTAQQTMQQAELGYAFFAAFALVSVGGMGLIGPVLTANAIGAERLAKTLPVLLMTPIGAWQVVSGKLFSRALTALTLLGLSLPVLALVRLLGGVELEQMAAVLAIAASVMIVTAAIGLFYSLFLNRAAVVILLSYATMAVLYGLLPVALVVLAEVGKNGPRSGGSGIAFIMAINPAVTTGLVCNPTGWSSFGQSWVPCVLTQIGIATFLLLWTAALLRRQFRNGGERAVRAIAPVATPPLAPGVRALEDGLADGSTSDVASSAVPPPLPVSPATSPVPTRPASNVRPPRDVSDNPVLWREVRRPMFNKAWQRVVAAVVVLGSLALIYLVLAKEHALDDPEPQLGFAFAFCGVWWLVAAVLSATAISQEKESDTWTLLLAAPLSGSQIVWGKAAGLLRRMIWPTALMAAHFVLFAVTGIIPWWAVPFVVGMTVACNALWVATGVWLSLRMRKVTFAVVANVMLAVLSYGVLPLAVYIPFELIGGRHDGEVAEHALWVNPYYYLGNGFDGVRRQSRNWRYAASSIRNQPYYEADRLDFRIPREQVGFGPFAAAAATCAALHLLAAFLVLRTTAANFDTVVGRAGLRRFAGAFDGDNSVLAANDADLAGGSKGVVEGRAVAVPATGDDAAPVPYAGLARRAVAAAIDVAIIVAFFGVVGVAAAVVALLLYGDRVTSNDAANAVVRGWVWMAMKAAAVLGWVVLAVGESSARRATAGKMLMGIFVTDAEGRRLTLPRALLRNAVKVASIVPLGVGFLVAATDSRRRAWQDRAAGTMVIRR